MNNQKECRRINLLQKRESLKWSGGRIMVILIKSQSKLIQVKMDSKTMIKVAIFVNSSIKYDDAWASVFVF